MKIKIADIAVDGVNRKLDKNEVAKLALSIGALGQLQPILVVAKKGDTSSYELIAGRHRLEAAKKLGWTEIEATVKVMTEEIQLAACGAENLVRHNTSPIEDAILLKKIFGTTPAPSIVDVAKQLGVDEDWVIRRRRLIGLSDASIKIWAHLIDADLSAAGVSKWEAVACLSSETQADFFKQNNSVWILKSNDAKKLMSMFFSKEDQVLDFPWIHDENNQPESFKVTGCSRCNICNQRSDRQKDLFAKDEIQKAAVCLNQVCKDKKFEAYLPILKKRAQADGTAMIVMQYGVNAPAGTLERNSFDEVPAKTKGAVKALIVAGPEAGHQTFIKIRKDAPVREKAKVKGKDKPVAKPDIAPAEAVRIKEARLLEKRSRLAIEKLIEKLHLLAAPSDGHLLLLVAMFGTQWNKSNNYDKVAYTGDPIELRTKLWKEGVAPVIASHLKVLTMADIDDRLKQVKSLEALIGFNFTPFVAEAVKEIPEPKSLADAKKYLAADKKTVKK